MRIMQRMDYRLIMICTQFGFYEGDIILRGGFSVNYISLRVTINMATYLTLGVHLDQPNCHPMPDCWHTRDLAVTKPSVLNAEPTTCRYPGNEVISEAPPLWQFNLNWVCDQSMCNELLLWLRPRYRVSLNWLASVRCLSKHSDFCER